MMFALLIEIQRGSAWNLIQTIPVPSFPNDRDQRRAKRTAMLEAQRALSAWSSYFAGDRLRIREAG